MFLLNELPHPYLNQHTCLGYVPLLQHRRYGSSNGCTALFISPQMCHVCPRSVLWMECREQYMYALRGWVSRKVGYAVLQILLIIGH